MALTIADLLVRLTGDASDLQAKLAQGSAAVSRFGQNVKSAGMTISGSIGLPLAAVGAASVHMAEQFDTSMTKIVTLVGVARPQVDAWREDIIRLSTETGRPAKELADAMFFITSAGLKGATALSALRASAQAAATGLGETKTIADAATSAMNAYGQSNLSADQAVSVMIESVRLGKMEASEFAGVVGRVIPVSAEMGVSFSQVGAAAAAMSRLGLSAAEGMTAFRAIMMTTLRPTQDARDKLASVGLSVESVRKAIQERGIYEALMMLRTAFKGNIDAMAAVFPNVRALTGILNLTGKSAEEAGKIFREMGTTTSKALETAFGEASQSNGVKFRQAQQAINEALITLGESVIPVVAPALKGLASVAQAAAGWFDKLPGPIKTFAVATAGLAVVAGPALIVLGGLITTVGIVSKAVVGATGFILAKTGALIGNTAATAANTAAQVASAAAHAASGGLVAQYTAFMNGSTAAVTMNTAALRTSSAAITTKVGLLTQLTTQWAPAAAGSRLFGASLQAGLVVAVGLAAYGVGRLISSVTGLDNLLLTSADKGKDTAKGWAKSQEAWDAAVASTTKLRDSLGLTGKEWDINTERSAENAVKLEALNGKLVELASKHNKDSIAAREHAAALTADAGAASDNAGGFDNLSTAAERYAEELRKQHGLLTSGEVTTRLEEMGAAYQQLLSSGIAQTQVTQALKGDFGDLIDQAKEYGLALPAGAQGMADAMATADEEIRGKLAGLAEATAGYWDATGGQMLTVFETASGTMGEQVGNAIVIGAKTGFVGAGREYDRFSQEVAQNSLRVTIDREYVRGQIAEAVREGFENMGV